MSDARDESFRWRGLLPIAAVACGLIILVVSFLVPARMVGRAAWSPEEAKKYQETSSRLHSLSHSVLRLKPGEDARTMQDQLRQAESDYASMREELDSAIARPKRLAWFLRIIGVCLSVGGGTLLILNQSARET